MPDNKDLKPYDPLKHSVVQFATGEHTESYEATNFHQALLFAIARKIGLVHWNRYQKSWDRWSDDPHIPGIEWRSYRYLDGCDCPDVKGGDSFLPSHEENCIAMKPNFEFEGVCFSWYKNPGRGMSVNKVMPEKEWAAWFNRCLAKIKEFDPCRGDFVSRLTPLPKAGHFRSARCDVLYSKNQGSRGGMGELDLAVAEADNSIPSEDFWKIVGSDIPELRVLFMRAVAAGVRAEKKRAQDEDR